MLRFLDPEFMPNHKIMSSGKKKKRFLADKWVVRAIFGWFVDGLDSLWVVWAVWMVCGWLRVSVNKYQ